MRAAQRARERDGVLLLHAAHRHAKVARLGDDHHAFGLEWPHQRIGDLLREALLELKAARQEIDQARDLRESDDAAPRQVADVHRAVERKEMMLAERMELDVASPSAANTPLPSTDSTSSA